jgi:hypothetical protein
VTTTLQPTGFLGYGCAYVIVHSSATAPSLRRLTSW